jgi:hypothetical protein
MNIETRKQRAPALVFAEKRGLNFICCFTIISMMSQISEFASETRPKLAVAGAELAPALARKHARQGADYTNQAAKPPELEKSMYLGEWTGHCRRGRINFNLVLQISKSQDGSINATLENTSGQKTWRSTAVALNATEMKLEFHVMAARAYGGDLVGNLDVASQSIQASWTRFTPPVPVVLRRVRDASTIAFVSSSVPSISLETLVDSINAQLTDQLGAAGMFDIMDSVELAQAVQPSRGGGSGNYNLKELATATQIKKAGIHYLLLTTIEDFTDQDVDLAQGSLVRQTENLNLEGSGRSSTVRGVQRAPGQVEVRRDAGRSGSLSASDAITQESLDPRLKKAQIFLLAVRCRLFDVTTGALLDSATHTFKTNRSYVVLAQGRNDLATSDVIQKAAKNVSEWAVVRVGDAIAPMKVLDRNDQEVTINRGLGAGIHTGQVYHVFTPGKELRDPSTGEVLDRPEVKVGRVAITDLYEKFSSARILEDKGISAGARLRLAVTAD